MHSSDDAITDFLNNFNVDNENEDTFDTIGQVFDIDSEQAEGLALQSFENKQEIPVETTDQQMERLALLEKEAITAEQIKKLEDFKKRVLPLAPIDHTNIPYNEFQKQFYKQKSHLLTEDQVKEMRKSLNLEVGYDPDNLCPLPVDSFFKMNLPSEILKVINYSQWNTPTEIQQQAIPAIMNGLNVIGIAKTGSGKTAAFVIPLIIHVLHQVREHKALIEMIQRNSSVAIPTAPKVSSPFCLILTPTHELCDQVYLEVVEFAKAFRSEISVTSIHGGSGTKNTKWNQEKHLRKNPCQILVATPGRLIHHIRSNLINLQLITILVIDEADQMMDLGYEPQVRSIVQRLNPFRQSCLFSATLPPRIERILPILVSDAIRIRTLFGNKDIVNRDIDQNFHLFDSDDSAPRVFWLTSKFDEFLLKGQVLIFCNRKTQVQDLYKKIHKYKPSSHLVSELQKAYGMSGHYEPLGFIHGDLSKGLRQSTSQKFLSGKIRCLVCTDLFSRGIDVRTIKTVVNFYPPSKIATYIHRVGRTGRAGSDGSSWTLFSKTNSDFKFASQLCLRLYETQSPYYERLLDIAKLNQFFMKNHYEIILQSSQSIKKSNNTADIDFPLDCNVSALPSARVKRTLDLD